jgi:hypothetical protein
VKIDRGFIEGIGQRTADTTIVRSVVNLASFPRNSTSFEPSVANLLRAFSLVSLCRRKRWATC